MIKETIVQHYFKKRLTRRFPVKGQWELTFRCNLKCVMCYTECFDTPQHIKREIGREALLDIADQLVEAGVVEMVLTGGEIFMHPHFQEVYKRLYDGGIRLKLFTNGILIRDSLAKFLANRPPLLVEISMHGIGERFDEIVGVKGSFERCLEGIKALQKYQIRVMLKTLGMTINEDQILQIKELADSFEKTTWYLGMQMREELNQSKMPLQLQLSESKLQEITKNDIQMRAEYDSVQTRLKASDKAVAAGDTRCASINRFHIDPYGGLQLCSSNRKKSYSLLKGRFKDGFYRALPLFPCNKKQNQIKPKKQRSLLQVIHS